MARKFIIESISNPSKLYDHESLPGAYSSSFPRAKEISKLDKKTRKTRRGWGDKATKLTIFGNNPNGIKAKRDSLINASEILVVYFCRKLN